MPPPPKNFQNSILDCDKVESNSSCSLRRDFLTNIKYEGFGEDKCIVIFSLAEDGHNGVMLVWSATDGNICIRPVQDFTLTHTGGDSWI